MGTELKVAAIAAKREVRCLVSDIARPELFRKLEEETPASHTLLDLAELGLAVGRLGARVFRIDGQLRIVVCRDNTMIPLEAVISGAFADPPVSTATAKKEEPPIHAPVAPLPREATQASKGGSPGNVSKNAPAGEPAPRARKDLSELSAGDGLEGAAGAERDKVSPGNSPRTPSFVSGTSGSVVLTDAATSELQDLWAGSLLDGL